MRKLLLVPLVLLLFTCSSKSEIVLHDSESGATAYVEKVVVEKAPAPERRHGFRYTVPDFMEESDLARRFNLRNMLVYKDSSYVDSPVIITIRQTDKYADYTPYRFVKTEAGYLQKQAKARFENTNWIPPGFEEKKIDHKTLQFYYNRGGAMVYQRSVYIKLEDQFYIVSLSSRYKKFMLEEKNDLFWSSICVD